MLVVHPGGVLKRELEAREMWANKLVLALRLPSSCIIDILNGSAAFHRNPLCVWHAILATVRNSG